MIRSILTGVAVFFCFVFMAAVFGNDHPLTSWGWFNFACIGLVTVVAALLAIAWKDRS